MKQNPKCRYYELLGADLSFGRLFCIMLNQLLCRLKDSNEVTRSDDLLKAFKGIYKKLILNKTFISPSNGHVCDKNYLRKCDYQYYAFL